MRRILASSLIAVCLTAFLSPQAVAQGVQMTPLLNCNEFEAGDRIAVPEAGNTQSSADQCRAVVCGALLVERNTFYDQLRNYPLALDEAFEEIFVRLKAALQNYANSLEGICGVERNPLPLCGVTQSVDGQPLLNAMGIEVTTTRTRCTAEVEVLLDVADTVIRELLLRLAGDQRVHTYARRIDALAKQFREINNIIALIGNYLAKISIPTVVGDAPKS